VSDIVVARAVKGVLNENNWGFNGILVQTSTTYMQLVRVSGRPKAFMYGGILIHIRRSNEASHSGPVMCTCLSYF